MTLNEIHQLNGSSIFFWVIGCNEGTNNKIRKYQSFKEYWNQGNHEIKRVKIENIDSVTALLVCNINSSMKETSVLDLWNSPTQWQQYFFGWLAVIKEQIRK